jgi:DNA-directed RNA polymerase specialized sigma24 family protein
MAALPGRWHGPTAPWAPIDAVEEVALVSRAKRDVLLRAHRFRLRYEDLEDCYSQATLELLGHARRGAAFASRVHLARVLEQRFVSRIHDRRRAISGRSAIEAALEGAAPLASTPQDGQLDIADAHIGVEQLVILRHELASIGALGAALSADQRLVLASQLHPQMRAGEFCRRHGWSPDKYRKVAQRGRARLRQLLQLDDASDVPRARRAPK